MLTYFSLAIGVNSSPGVGERDLHCEEENFENLINRIFKGRET
jgi:hypothetical protein